jgi:trehalose synthase
MWHRKPVVAGRTVGTTAQVVDGVTGYLVPNTGSCADKTAALLADPSLCERLGENGRNHVANHFLVTRYLADAMQLLARVVNSGVAA